MNEAELYRELGRLTKNRDQWEAQIPFVAALLTHDSVKIQAKALWLLGEMGLAHPSSVQDVVPLIAAFFNSPVSLLRERAAIAIGRIGRGSFSMIAPYWAQLFCFATDRDAKVRLGFIWASENIAVNTPDIYEHSMPVFAKLLYDTNEKVRMEAPEIFRVLGARRPEFVQSFIAQLQKIARTDAHPVVRIHCSAAIKAVNTALKKTDEP